MDSILNLIEEIPALMLYIVPGFLYLITYHGILAQEHKVDSKHVIFKSIILSYVFQIVCFPIWYAVFPTSRIGDTGKALLLSCAAVVFGYLVAVGSRTRIIQKILLWVGIHTTTNGNFWDDIIKDRTWICIVSKDKEVQYIGQCRYYEPNTRTPYVGLVHFQLLDLEGNVITDYFDEDENEQIVVVPLDNFSRVDVIYKNPSDNSESIPSDEEKNQS